ncbi:MAG: type II toxin-antitoxin system mRNA interferase toxin, RelE/StbE family [Symploca sp. SIO2G7]|nr:type II toxin-antitoxin system mRNA interferase toxin, RelE/StbE family [Symploca sp. SIO2G7]
MKNLVFSSSFKRAFKGIIKRRPELKERIEERLRILVDDPFNPVLRTHKLKGDLSGSWSMTVDYDCRIVFGFEKNQNSGEDEILLIDIGTHDEIY